MVLQKENGKKKRLQWSRKTLQASCIKWRCFNTLCPRRSGRYFADNIFKYIFLNESIWFPIKISKKSVPKGPIDSIPALVNKMAWRPGDK